MQAGRLVFWLHAIRRMYERKIGVEDVRQVVASGEVIEEYPDDTPYSGCLMLGWPDARPIHVVVAHSSLDRETIVITVYEPDPARWEPCLRRRT